MPAASAPCGSHVELVGGERNDVLVGADIGMGEHCAPRRFGKERYAIAEVATDQREAVANTVNRLVVDKLEADRIGAAG